MTGRALDEVERLTPLAALRSYMLGGAYATGREARLGSLEPGELADFVVLDRDPPGIPAGELPEVRPLAIVLGGRFVHDAR